MKGKLYGIGTGPGDPELLTLKALRIMNECAVIAVPGENPHESTAYKIASAACPGLEKKELLGINMPMVKDKAELEESHKRGAKKLCEILGAGKDIAFLTLGDPSVYSTYMYLHKIVAGSGYETEIINGIPSFCAACARLGTALAQGGEEIHIIPASYRIEDALSLPGTKVFMKAGKNIARIKSLLSEADADAAMVCCCGMEDEKVYYGAENIPEDAGYYSLIIIKERR